MIAQNEIHLSRAEYHLGVLVPLSDLPLSVDERDTLRAQGLATVSRIGRPLSELLPELLYAHIEQHHLPDAIVIVSNSLETRDISAITYGLARNEALAALPIQFLTSGDCTNFHHALQLGCSFLQAGFARDVLLVAADKVAEALDGTIRAEFGGGLAGDAVAMCRLGLKHEGFRLLSAPAIVKDATVAVGVDAKLALSLKNLRRAVRNVVPERSMVARIKQVIPNTYTRQSAELLSLASRVPEERIFVGNVPRTGHCFAADNVINFVDWCDEQHETKSQILMLASGVFQWSAVLLDGYSQHYY